MTRRELINISNTIRNASYLRRDSSVVFIVYRNPILSPSRDIGIVRLKLVANSTL